MATATMAKSGQASTRWTSLRSSTYRPLLAQASTEYLILLAMALVIMMMVTVFVYLWPDYTYSIRKQRSDNYWQTEHPFSVMSNAIYPDQLVLEIQNNEPISLTVSKVWVDGTPMNFYKHNIPFDWAVTDQCGSGTCAMTIRPGETKIISTYNYTSSPANPCLVGTSYTAGLDYEVDFAIVYYATDPSSPENETGNFPLIGKCTAR